MTRVNPHVGIRGMGAVCSLGNTLRACSERLVEGAQGFSSIHENSHILDRNVRAAQFHRDASGLVHIEAAMFSAVSEALSAAKLTKQQSARCGVFVGTTGGLVLNDELAFYASKVRGETHVFQIKSRGVGECASKLAKSFSLGGPVATYSMACTSSANALLSAEAFLRADKIEFALVVGIDALLNINIGGFKSLLLYDEDACRPFCKSRNGMMLGEGVGAVVLEKNDCSQFRLFPGDTFSDNYHLTGSNSDGIVAANVMTRALSRAKKDPSQIIAIKAHGTGTPDNDLAEGRGLAKIFAQHKTPFTSLKGAIGHTLGACGTLELALFLDAVSRGTIPKTAGFKALDDEIGMSPLSNNIAAKSGAYLFNYFGFGGSCVSFVVDVA